MELMNSPTFLSSASGLRGRARQKRRCHRKNLTTWTVYLTLVLALMPTSRKCTRRTLGCVRRLAIAILRGGESLRLLASIAI